MAVRDYPLSPGGLHGHSGFNISMLPSASHLQGQLTRFAGDIRSLAEPINRAIEDVIIPRVRDNFARQTAAGDSWDDWSTNTPFMPYHTEFGPASRKLDVTGTLRGQAISKDIWTIDNQAGSAQVFASSFTRAPYAKFMQEGAPNNTSPHGHPAPIPPRPFIVINDRDIDDINDIFENWLEARFNYRVAGGMIGDLAGSNF